MDRDLQQGLHHLDSMQLLFSSAITQTLQKGQAQQNTCANCRGIIGNLNMTHMTGGSMASNQLAAVAMQ